MLNTVNILEGNTFAVSNRQGDMDGTPEQPHGLFSNDMRFISKWVLSINGVRPATLSVDETNYYEAQFFDAPSTGTTYIDSPISVIRKRAVFDGFHEWITIKNFNSKPATLNIDLEIGSDFADLFEVKDDKVGQKKGKFYQKVENGMLIFGYKRDSFVRETRIRALYGDPTLDEKGIHFTVTLEPQAMFMTELDVLPFNPDNPKEWVDESIWKDPEKRLGLRAWAESLPQLQTDWVPLYAVYNRSLTDLAALRFSMFGNETQSLPAAGLPWFMTVFGRDSLITSFQALPYMPQLAEAALLTLGAFQAEKMDDFRDAEPGKILHEFRFGELAAFEEVPQSPYYGSADSTMWYLILLDEYERWTGRVDIIRQLEPIARAALEWIDKYGDQDGDGYVEYQRRNAMTGLENQCWKDSWNSIQWADGRLAELPRATCELQGYVYDAKVRSARLAREFWNDSEFADRLEKEAADLKERFNKDFWLEEKGYFALALDGKKQKVDALSSNIGHLLWSGIVDDNKASVVVEHLMSDRLFSGWGVRTFADGQIGYNPIGYHVGTVWPHDNAIIMLGLRRYGYDSLASRIGMALLEAADVMGGRLPETFAGFSRAQTTFPAEYPTACSPQAWASGAPLMVISGLLGLKPQGAKLEIRPGLPEKIRLLQLQNVPGRWGLTDVGIDLNDSIVVELKDKVPAEVRQTAAIFEGIAKRINPRNTVGRRVVVGFNLGDKGTWRIVAENGKVAVDQRDEPGDVAFNMSLEMLTDILSGKKEINTAMMSGQVKVHGNTSILVRAIRILARPNDKMMPLSPGGRISRAA